MTGNILAGFSYGTVVAATWLAFLIVWTVTAVGVKRDVSGANFWTGRFWILRVVVALILAIFVIRLSGARTSHIYLLYTPLPVIGWIGATLVVVGIGCAIWARIHLGRNWSPRPVAKEHHELVTSGPYAHIRHPIYAGVLLAGFGTVIAGSVLGLGVCVLGTIIFVSRIHREESIMLSLFPDTYPAYMARTKRLMPYVW